jgi:hypothetical protein
MLRLLLIRHGETAWNAEGRLQGQADPPLSPRGRQQARALAHVVAAETVHAVYASDLRRAWETACILAAPLGLQVQQEPRWREMAFGYWEGLTLAQIRQRNAAALVAWQADAVRVAPPGGETLTQVTERVKTALTASPHPSLGATASAQGPLGPFPHQGGRGKNSALHLAPLSVKRWHMAAKVVMIQGTSSSAGKSLLVTALCRLFARRGVRVAPFKAQNMSNNAAVCADGAEIGRSQAVQAATAGVPPSAEMNPILLKPEGNTRSQVIVLGRPWHTLAAREYYRHKAELWPVVTTALERLRAAYELVVIPAPWRPAWCHGARPAVVERGAGATRRRRGGRKEALFFLSVEVKLLLQATLDVAKVSLSDPLTAVSRDARGSSRAYESGIITGKPSEEDRR